MATTNEWGIHYPTLADTVSPASRDFPWMATSADAAMTRIKGSVQFVEQALTGQVDFLTARVDALAAVVEGGFDSDPLRQWRRDIAESPWERATMVMFGDSITEGVWTSDPTTYFRQSALIQEDLTQGLGGNTIPVISSGLTTNAVKFFEADGTPIPDGDMERDAGRGPAGQAVNLQNGRQAVFPVTFCDRIKVHYACTNFFALRCNVSIDGADAPDAPPGMSSSGFSTWPESGEVPNCKRVWDSGPLTPGAHELILREWDNSEGACIIEMVEFCNADETTGIRVLPWAQAGHTAKSFSDENGFSEWWYPWERLEVIDPQLVTIALGTNDIINYDATEFARHYNFILDEINRRLDPSAILCVVPFDPVIDTETYPLMGNWEDYRQVIISAATERNLGLLDLREYGNGGKPWPDFMTTDWQALFNEDDNLHPNQVGQGRVAESYLQAIRVDSVWSGGVATTNHTHTLDQITDLSYVGEQFLTAGTQEAARQAVGIAEYGTVATSWDTELIDLSGSVSATDWSNVTEATIRRVGHEVSLAFSGTPLVDSSTPIAIPEGFRPTGVRTAAVVAQGSTVPFGVAHVSTGASSSLQVFLDGVGTTPHYVSLSWATDDEWPAAYPGVVFGTAPSWPDIQGKPAYFPTDAAHVLPGQLVQQRYGFEGQSANLTATGNNVNVNGGLAVVGSITGTFTGKVAPTADAGMAQPTTLGGGVTTGSAGAYANYAQWRNGICIIHLDFAKLSGGSLEGFNVATFPNSVPPPKTDARTAISGTRGSPIAGSELRMDAGSQSVRGYVTADSSGRYKGQLIYFY